MTYTDNELNRFGSAAFAQDQDIARAGMFRETPSAMFLGFHGDRKLWYHGMGGGLLVAGARGGKLRDMLAYNICHGTMSDESLMILDMKRELGAISEDQTPDKKFCIYWDPMNDGHRINPLDYIRIDSPTLVSDVKVLCENLIPLSGSANGQFFEQRAREFLEGIILTLTRMNGCLDFPSLYEAINLIPGGGDAWLDFGFEMSEAGFSISTRIEEEIAASRANPQGGFMGIIGELMKAFAALSDPLLMRSVSSHPDGSYDFSFEDLCRGNQRYQVYLCPPAEFIDAWAPVIKAHFVAAMLYKSRAPQAPRQTWIIDETAQLNKFPLAIKMYTYGAGIGIRPLCVFQSVFQMDALGPGAKNIITSSAALQIYFAIRDIESAEKVSRMLGAETLSYTDEAQVERARHAKAQMLDAMLQGQDPFGPGIAYAHEKRRAELRPKQHRLLRTPDEVLNMPSDKAFIFVDGLSQPIYADRRPYYEQRFMAGRYFENPYYSPDPRGVRCKAVMGYRYMPIIEEPVPSAYAHYPQYKDGRWRRLKR